MTKGRPVTFDQIRRAFGLSVSEPAKSQDLLRISGTVLPDPAAPPAHECRRSSEDGTCAWSKCPRRSPCPLDHHQEWLNYFHQRS